MCAGITIHHRQGIVMYLRPNAEGIAAAQRRQSLCHSLNSPRNPFPRETLPSPRFPFSLLMMPSAQAAICYAVCACLRVHRERESRFALRALNRAALISQHSANGQINCADRLPFRLFQLAAADEVKIVREKVKTRVRLFRRRGKQNAYLASEHGE